MRKLVFAVTASFLFLTADIGSAAVRVKGYYRKNGTYVQPHYRSDPNGSTSDNWSAKGNVNPYTGAVGTKSADHANEGGYTGSAEGEEEPQGCSEEDGGGEAETSDFRY